MTSEEIVDWFNSCVTLGSDLRKGTRISEGIQQSRNPSLPLWEIAYQLAKLNELYVKQEADLLGLAAAEPGKRDADSERRGRFWLIYFDDNSMRPEVYGNEGAARRAFDARRENWNCHLFEQRSQPADPAAEASTQERGALPRWESRLEEEWQRGGVPLSQYPQIQPKNASHPSDCECPNCKFSRG